MKLKEFVVFLGMMLLCSGVAVAGISFVDPTPANNSRIYNNYSNINVSISVDDLTNFTFNWNGTNTTYLNDSCVLHLSFDNNSEIGDNSTMVRDVSSYNNNGSFVNGSTGNWTTDGKWNGAMSFDGQNDYVDCGNDSSLNPTDEITISAWINALSTSWTYVVAKNDGGCDNSAYGLIITDIGAPRLLIWDSGMFGADYTGGALVSTGVWHFVIGTYDGSNIITYLDGNEVKNIAHVGSIDLSPIDCFVGKREEAQFFNGSIEEVRIYNRALTSAEIRQSYLSSLRKFNKSQWYFETNQTDLTDGEYNYQAFANNNTITYNTPYNILTAILKPHISCYSKYPETLYTNYTGFLSTSYLIESNSLNMSSLAFLMGTNYTLTADYHSYLKVPANSIADNGVYRAHNRNTTPYLTWESNDTITEGNVWKWAGGDNNDFWVVNNSINDTHTWINISGRASNVFPSMFYLGRRAMYESEKTAIEINKGQGVIFKIWDLEQFRGRSNDYYLNMFFDTQMEADTSNNIELWYCNDSFNPNSDDPCLVCDYKDSWNQGRWMNHSNWQPHNNVSYARPLQIHAGTTCPSSPTEVNYIYLKSDTVSGKSFILNATNADPGICNLTYAQTNTMWLRNEVAGTNSPIAYTPSFFNTFTRDYLEFVHHLYIANSLGTWGHSDYTNHSIGISNINPTHCRFNYFQWNGTTDYNMTGTYDENFNINLTYGYDPDNGASLTHVLSLYDDGYNFVAFINDSLVGNQIDVTISFDIHNYTSKYSGDCYRFKIVSTDNEASTSVTWSNEFCIERETWLPGTIDVLKGFPSTISNILASFLSFLPLFIGILISGFLILVCVGVFSKLKQW